MSKQRVLILGSTGSIGQNCLEVLKGMPDGFEVAGLACGTRSDVLSEQASEWAPEAVAVTDSAAGQRLATTLDKKVRLHTGPCGMVDMMSDLDFDCAVIGVVGAHALPPALRAVELGKRVAIANKESFVMAGALLSKVAERSNATIIPVDSEHSAVFQSLHAGRACDVRRVVLTASGGPFRTWSLEHIASATLKDALNHPTWDMGPKITIDSATMMNKALEIVEAKWLFGLEHDQIDVIVHPESIVHSLVEFHDGSMVAQMGTPDMRTPIQYALTYPARRPCPSPKLDLTELRALSFFQPDLDRFPALSLGYKVARRGGTAGAVLNAANESAVQLFRDGLMGFVDITATVGDVLERHPWIENPTLDELMRADVWAREEVLRCTTC